MRNWVSRLCGGVLAEAWRDVSEEAGGIEDLVIKREIIAGNEVDPGGLLLEPVLAAQLAAGFLQLFAGEISFPVKFGGVLQFAVLPDARVAEVMSADAWHGPEYQESSIIHQMHLILDHHRLCLWCRRTL